MAPEYKITQNTETLRKLIEHDSETVQMIRNPAKNTSIKRNTENLFNQQVTHRTNRKTFHHE